MDVILVNLVFLQSILVAVKHSCIILCHLLVLVNGKDHVATCQCRHRGGGQVQIYLCLRWAPDGHWKETQYPLYMRLGGPQGWSGWV
jgi:hypothetical protein